MSRGIFEVLSWRELEDLLIQPAPMQELADRIIMEADRKKPPTGKMEASYFYSGWRHK